MPTERQIAANRRNAQKSTGPRTLPGKERASRSYYRHGLRARTPPAPEGARRIERLARKIADASTDTIVLEAARAAAQAEFDIAQVRRVKVVAIEQMRAVGAFVAVPTSLTRRKTKASIPLAKAGAAAEPECMDEAVWEALPQLLKLDRYERRAMARLSHSLRIIHDRIVEEEK